jgi:hypothetical protein
MGIHRNNGYSATVEGFFVVDGARIRLAKTNDHTFVVAESCELVPGTTGQLLVIVDGNQDSKLVTLPDGVLRGQTLVNYKIAAPF